MARHPRVLAAPLYSPIPAVVVPLPPAFLMMPRPMAVSCLPPVLLMRPMPRPRSRSMGSTVQVRSVWAHNLVEELELVRSLLSQFRFVSIDTEFPGTIHRSEKPHYLLTPEERYALLKANVDDLHLIQLGLTLFDEDGGLPDLGTNGAVGFVWEFNFRDFDISRDGYAPESVHLLESHGFDFQALKAHGIDSRDFAELLFRFGIVCTDLDLHWITFSGGYDFAYLVKMLVAGQPLPDTSKDLVELIEVLFGKRVFDVKEIARECAGLHGGLERLASTFGMAREAGSAHQAGSDSLLTCRTFSRLRDTYFARDGGAGVAGRITGLQLC